MDADLKDLIGTIVTFAAQSRERYASTKEWTIGAVSSCETIRVPVALLNRIRDLGEAMQPAPAGPAPQTPAELLSSLKRQAITCDFAQADDAAHFAAHKIADKVALRVLIERAIVRHAVQALIDAGYAITVDDGEETVLRSAEEWQRVMPHIGHCDEEWLNIMEPRAGSENDAEGPKWRRFGSIHLVYGNGGWDVLSNYTEHLEPVLERTLDLAAGIGDLL
jgi:hypothetical protein